ncbi:MAG: ABC transporter permease [Bacteroidia bacterium]|nr:ABC transporter permease [Bacteroidia bacterium]
MRTVLFFIQKEFIQVFRNRAMLPIIFIVPVVQLVILVHAATFEMKNIKLAVVDNDLSTYSRGLTSHFSGSPFFKIRFFSFSMAEADKHLLDGTVDAIIAIPDGFEKNLVNDNRSSLQLIINAINGSTAGLINAYTTGVIAAYSTEINQTKSAITANLIPKKLNMTYTHWYNPELNYKTFMVPGILVLLVTIISFLLSGMNIVREKEIGTIEQINVTPVKKWQFIAGKLIPFWLLALGELAFGLFIGKLLFDIPILGSLWIIFLVASIYIISILAMGLFVSTVTHTQQQAMFISFFIMMIFILMSGLFTAIENMPQWAQWIDKLNPVAYFIRVMRMVMLKGSGIHDIRTEIISLIVISVSLLLLAVFRYRKVS